jgi:hypothetical protein
MDLYIGAQEITEKNQKNPERTEGTFLQNPKPTMTDVVTLTVGMHDGGSHHAFQRSLSAVLVVPPHVFLQPKIPMYGKVGQGVTLDQFLQFPGEISYYNEDDEFLYRHTFEQPLQIDAPVLMKDYCVGSIEISFDRHLNCLSFPKSEAILINVCANMLLRTLKRHDENNLCKAIMDAMGDTKKLHTTHGEIRFLRNSEHEGVKFKCFAMKDPDLMRTFFEEFMYFEEFMLDYTKDFLRQKDFVVFNTYLIIVNTKIGKPIPRWKMGNDLMVKALENMSKGCTGHIAMGPRKRNVRVPVDDETEDSMIDLDDDGIGKEVGLTIRISNWSSVLDTIEGKGGAQIDEFGVLPGESQMDDAVIYYSGAMTFTFKMYDNQQAIWSKELHARVLLLSNYVTANIADMV